MAYLSFVLRTISISLFSMCLFAQEVRVDSNAQPGVSDSMEIIVTAQRRSERLQDVPISVTALPAELLAKAGVISTTDLPLLTTGLTMQANGSYWEANIRGITTGVAGPGSDNAVAFYVDGLYISGKPAIDLELPDVERIEVLKGPQGTLFGRNAEGGAIQIFTKAPSFTPTGSIAATAGLFDGAGSSRSSSDFNVKGFVSGPLISETLAGSLAFAKRHVQGYSTDVVYGAVSPAIDGAIGSPRLDSLDSDLLRAKLLFTPTDHLEVLATAYYTKRDGNPGGVANQPFKGRGAGSFFSDSIFGTSPWQYAYDSPKVDSMMETYGASLQITAHLELGTFTSITGRTISLYNENTDTDGTYSPACLLSFTCLAVHDVNNDKNVSQDFIFTSRKFGKASFISGANLFLSTGTFGFIVDDFSSGAQPTLPSIVFGPIAEPSEAIKTRSIGLFTEGNYDLTDALTMIAGVRVTQDHKSGELTPAPGAVETPFQTKTWTSFTPRFSLRYALSSQSDVYATYSKGFKAGVYTLMDARPPPANPEKISAYEVGFKTASQRSSFNVAAFYYDYRDLQVQTSLTPVIIATSNAASAKIAGIDADETFRLFDGLSVHAGASWLPKAEYEKFTGATGFTLPFLPNGALTTEVVDLSNTRLFRTPELTGTAGATYEKKLSHGELSASGNVAYSSKYYYEAFHYFNQNAYARIGAELAYSPDNSNLRLSFWGRNLTNNAAIGSQITSNAGLTFSNQPPRELGFTAQYDF